MSKDCSQDGSQDGYQLLRWLEKWLTDPKDVPTIGYILKTFLRPIDSWPKDSLQIPLSVLQITERV